MRIRAAVTRAVDRPPQIEALDLDEPRADEVLVRVVASGVCHTDLFAPHLVRLPAVFGHEGAGVVERVGSAVRKVRVGDRVVMTFGSCGTCVQCAADSPAYCEHGHDYQFAGLRRDGTRTLRGGEEPISGAFFSQSSFANYALGTERSVVPIPDDMAFERAAPLGCGIQTGAGAVLNILRVQPGESLAVFGVGAVGLAAVMAARIAAAAVIVAVDVIPERLALARELGATHVIDARTSEVVPMIRELTRGGVRYSFETAGQKATFTQALECLRHKGVCALATLPALGQPYSQTLLPLLMGGKSLVSVLEGDSDPDRFIPLLVQHHLAGRLPIERLIVSYPFEQIARALDDAEHGRVIKPVLRMM